MITTSTQWDSLVQIPAKMTIVARLYYGAEGASDYISLGSDDVIIDGERFLGVIKQIPRIEQSVDLLTHNPVIGSIKLDINNLEFQPGKRFSDFLEELGAGSDIGFENRRADIRLYIPGITSWANCFTLQANGIIRNPFQDWATGSIEIDDGVSLWLHPINDRVPESSAALPNIGLPNDSKGKINPSIWGNHQNLIEASSLTGITAAEWTPTHKNNFVQLVDLGDDEWLIAGHNVVDLDETDQDAIWAFDSRLNRMVQCFDVTFSEDSRGSIITLNDNQYLDFRLPLSASDGGTGFAWTNPGNIADNDISSTTTISLGNLDAGDLDIVFPADDIPTGEISDSRINLRGFGEWATAEARLYVNGDTSNLVTNNNMVTNFDANNNSIGSGASIEAITLTFEGLSGSGNPHTGQLQACYLSVLYQTTEKLQLYYGGRGREYGTWINGRSTAEGYTEDHRDDDDSGELIENPAGVLESFLRDKLSLVDANIDMDSFNILSNDVFLTEISNSITEEIESRDWLAKFLLDIRSFLWWATEGKFKVKALLNLYTSASVDRIIDFNDFNSLKFPRTKLKDQYTAVEVEYMLSQGNYLSITDLSQDTTLQTKYNVTAAQTTLTHKTDNVSQEAAANDIRNLLLRLKKQPHNLLEGSLGKENLDLDIGDIIQLKNMPYLVRGKDIESSYILGGQTIYPYWWIYKVGRGENMNLSAIQLHAGLVPPP